MKRLFLILTVLFGISLLPTSAQVKNRPDNKAMKETRKENRAERKELRKLEGRDINVLSKNNFTTSFGDATNVRWKRTDYFDEATFTKDGKVKTAFFDFDGNLVGTTERVTFTDVPASGQKEILKKYKDYTIGSVIFFDDNEFNESDMLLYGLQFDDEDNYFVELTKGKKNIVLRVNSRGSVYFFKDL
jgi:hypothetical protein